MAKKFLFEIATLGTVIASLTAAKTAQALTVVDTTPTWDGSSFVRQFGQPNTATYGQTFTVPNNSDRSLQSFSFFLQQDTEATLQFAGYIMAWNGDRASGDILYQSEQRSSTIRNQFEEFSFLTGGLQLLAGQQYVAFVNASNFLESGRGRMGQPQGTNPYANGEFVFLNHQSQFSEVRTQPWRTGFLGHGSDVAFKLTFDTAPQPIPTPALLPGLIGLGVQALRRRKTLV